MKSKKKIVIEKQSIARNWAGDIFVWLLLPKNTNK